MTKYIWQLSLHEQIRYARKFWEHGSSRITWAIYTKHLGLGCKDGTEQDYIDLDKLSLNNYLIQDCSNGCWYINKDKFNYSDDFYTQNF